MANSTLFAALDRLYANGGGSADWPVIAAALRAAQVLRERLDLADDADWGAVAKLDDFDNAFTAIFGPMGRITFAHPEDLAAVTETRRRAETATANRDAAIRKASANGETIRAIAEAAGLSPARVHQIIHGR